MIRRVFFLLALVFALAAPALDAPAGATTPSVFDTVLNGGNGCFSGAASDLNFGAKKYCGLSPSQLTTSRASVAYGVCNNQLYGPFGVNVPVIMPGCGLFSWEARTNLFTYSTALNNAAWSLLGGVVAAPTATYSQNDPAGGTTAVKLAYPAVSGGGAYSLFTETSAPALSYGLTDSASFWIKGAVGGEKVWILASYDSVHYYRQACLTVPKSVEA